MYFPAIFDIFRRMKPKNLVIDCDDTLWENNRYFLAAHDKFVALMGSLGLDTAEANSLLLRLEMENVVHYGYGARSQARSMADVYRLLTYDTDETVFSAIEAIGEEVFHHPVSPLPGVEDTLPRLSESYRLVMFTKGNPDEQMGKIIKSPLRAYFDHYKVVEEKTPESFGEMLAEFGLAPHETWMIGDSPKSDILPAIANGVRSVYIPFSMTWAHEHHELPEHPEIIRIDTFHRLSDLLL